MTEMNAINGSIDECISNGWIDRWIEGKIHGRKKIE